MRISLKNSVVTETQSVKVKVLTKYFQRHILLMPFSVPLEILPSMISPLKGRKTIRRNFTSMELAMFKQRGNQFQLAVHINQSSAMANQPI